jgi:glycosyltransferase involved in cell wall biosynthesis
LEDIEKAICKYNIDVLCFHTGYARADTYYEIALAKLMGIFVTMEIHTAFIALLKDQIDVSSQFIHMYRLVDRLITVSETDDCFWKCMGCKSVLVENPVETFGVLEKTDRINDKECFEIVWIGRIVQQPKHVLDAVDIIKLVHERLGNVRLHIIGMKDNEDVYKQLLDKTKDIADYVVIDEFQTDIQSVYQNADVVLMTSASESFSNVLAEAKVFARPVVMYELPWLRLAYDNTGVWSVKQRDVFNAAEAIICLLQDEKLWKKYSDEAWDAIQPDMNRDVTKEWMDIFEALNEDVDVNAGQNTGTCNAIRLLLDQMYGKGYPDYQINKGR